MNTKDLTDQISSYLYDNDLMNYNKLNVLENIRLIIIEKLRSENNTKILELINYIKNKNSIKTNLNIKDLDFDIVFYYCEKKNIIEMKESAFDVLEILLSGQKNYKIFDKENKSKYIPYKIMPFYGVVYSYNTMISSITAPNTTLLTINAKM